MSIGTACVALVTLYLQKGMGTILKSLLSVKLSISISFTINPIQIA